MRKILFFSNNNNKIREINTIFKKISVTVKSPNYYGINYEPKEVGLSFAENAKIKSFFGYKKIKIPCFADDSGICIEAMGGGPGIYSKNFLNKFKNKKKCFEYIFQRINKTGINKAYFKTAICLTLKENYHIVFEGRVDGYISSYKLGDKGFGYDPIFIPDGYKNSFGQISQKEKNLISHRSIAINKLINFLSI